MKRLIMALLAFAMLSIVLAPSAANAVYQVYVNTNKPLYNPGEQGTISIVIRNTGDDPIEIKNMTVIFNSWMLFTEDGWDKLGNMTFVYSPAINLPSKTGVAKLEDIKFTVPTDGRAMTTDVDILIWTNEGLRNVDADVRVLDPSSQNLLRSLDNIVMLLTVGAILAIVAAVIIAAAVFLSGRRPATTTWQKEA